MKEPTSQVKAFMQNERTKDKWLTIQPFFCLQSNHFSIMNNRVNYSHWIFLEFEQCLNLVDFLRNPSVDSQLL